MQLNENTYFKNILEEEKKSEFVIANELQNLDRQKAFTFPHCVGLMDGTLVELAITTVYMP